MANQKYLFKKFFEDYSKNVDNASSQFFWKLSDEIILGIITKYIKKPSTKETTILDAGGGTGRWIQVLSKIYNSKFILYDNSIEMLEAARKKKDLQELGDRLKIIQGNIENLSPIRNNSIDYIISTYNPISFTKKPASFFKEVKRILKPQGLGLIMGQGYLNAVASKINNYLADANELKKLDKTKMVRWNSSLPPLNVFSKDTFEELSSLSKLKTIKTYGIPIFIQPGGEDFDSRNKLKSKVSAKLEKNKSFFKVVYNLEMKYNSEDTIVNRGMNLMIVVQKK